MAILVTPRVVEIWPNLDFRALVLGPVVADETSVLFERGKLDGSPALIP